MKKITDLKEKEVEDELIIYEEEDEDTLFTTCPEITIKLDKNHDRKRKITIVSECEPNEKKGEGCSLANNRNRRQSSSSTDLRRRAMINSALSKSRSRSRSKSNDGRKGANSRSRSRSTGRSRSVSVVRNRGKSPKNSPKFSPKKSPNRAARKRLPSKPDIRLPNDLMMLASNENTTSVTIPSCIRLPSPLYILTEQQATGVSETNSIQFVTKILLTTRKLSLDDRKELYNEMVEAANVGTSRSSTDLHEDDSSEDFVSKIYYSSKGVYVHTVQVVKKIGDGKTSQVSEERVYSNICKTRIIGEKNKFLDGSLNISCCETIEARNQIYTRTEKFKIGLQTDKANGDYEIHSLKQTYDPTKTIKFEEKVLFDKKNIGISINHSAIANMSYHWKHEAGSFGEQTCEYRKVSFVFGEKNIPRIEVDGYRKVLDKKNSTPCKSDVSIQHENQQRNEKTPEKPQFSFSNFNNSSNSFLKAMTPQATSTPKSEASPITLHSSSAKKCITPVKSPGPTGPKSIRETLRKRSQSPNEVDVDKSLRSKSPSSRNLSAIWKDRAAKSPLQLTKPVNVAVSLAPKSPNTSSVYLFNTKSDPLAKSPNIQKSTIESPKGKLRIKETKITREVREESGKPVQIKEQKEETVKEHPVPLGRSVPRKPSKSPMKSPCSSTAPTIPISNDSICVNSDVTIPTQKPDPQSKAFREVVLLDTLVDGKPVQIRFNLDFLAKTKPSVDVRSIKFGSRVLWEKSSEWSIDSANTTSSTKTIAKQQSDILGKKETK